MLLLDKKCAAIAKNKQWQADRVAHKISKLNSKHRRVRLLWSELQETLLYCQDLTAELDDLEQDLELLQETTFESRAGRMSRRIDRLEKDVRRYKSEVILLVGR